MCKFGGQFVCILPPLNVSMAPCWTNHGNHIRQELDLWSDPSGTEARKTLTLIVTNKYILRTYFGKTFCSLQLEGRS